MKDKYTSLDGLRAYAALGILIMHVQANVPVRPEGGFLYDTFIPSLTHFVYLFIVISAFGLCCGYYDKFKVGAIKPNEFYLKRYKRLLPFFALLVFIDTVVPHAPNKYELEQMAAGSVVTGFTATLHSLYDAFAELTLAFNLLPNPSPPIGVAWFLGLIFLFYMIFPFFVFMMENKRRAWISLGLCYLFSFMAVDYFLTDKFINWEMTRHSIVYDAPFLGLGGIIFLYKDKVTELVSCHKWIVLILCLGLTCIYWFVPQSNGGFAFVVIMSVITSSWLCYAIGTNGTVLNNRIVSYLSSISLEIYLCHMACYKVVGFMHLPNYIDNIYLVYWLSCILTLCVAVAFSHVAKFYVLPLIMKIIPNMSYKG